jgi:hypothetical protein
MISLYSYGVEERAVYFSTESGKKRVVMFRYLLDTQRQAVLERDKGGGKRLESRKAVANAIVNPKSIGNSQKMTKRCEFVRGRWNSPLLCGHKERKSARYGSRRVMDSPTINQRVGNPSPFLW